MSDGTMFRWLNDADVQSIRESAEASTVEIAVRLILSLDPHVYDEDTVRAAANVVRDMLKRGGT